MITACYCLKRLPHLSREEFQQHWHTTHRRAAGPGAAEGLAIRRYTQLHTLDDDSSARLRALRASGDALFAATGSAPGRAVVRAVIADEANVVDWTRSTVVVGQEVLLE